AVEWRNAPLKMNRISVEIPVVACSRDDELPIRKGNTTFDWHVRPRAAVIWVLLRAGAALVIGTAGQPDLFILANRVEQERPVQGFSQGAKASDYTDMLIRYGAETRNLPADLSTNHNYYLHSLPKR